MRPMIDAPHTMIQSSPLPGVTPGHVPARRPRRGVRAGALVAGFSLVVALALSLPGCGGTTRPPGQATEPQSSYTKGEPALDSAKKKLEAGDTTGARLELMRLIETNPQMGEAQLVLGDVYFNEGNYEAAEPRFRKAAQLEPQSFRSQFMHGLTLHALNRLQDAVGAYLRALTINPLDFDANVNVASAYYALGDFSQALPFAQQSVRLNPRHGQARYNLAATLAALDRHEEAVVEFQQATELVTITPQLLVSMAESLIRTRRFDEAKAALERSIKLAPSPIAHERLGSTNFRMGNMAEASANFEAALQLDPEYYPALNGVGVCELNRWLESNRLDDAARQRGIGALRRSLQIKRAQPKVEDLLGRYK